MTPTGHAFELPSAKNLSVEAAVEQFVSTDLFWQMLASDGHDVILGTRGSGKTMLLRMMSVQHLAQYKDRDPRALAALRERKRYGIFMPFGVDWCVARADEQRLDRLFVDGVNLVSAEAYLDVLDALIRLGLEGQSNPIAAETTLSHELSLLWFRNSPRLFSSFASLRSFLWRQQAILRDLWRFDEPPTDVQEDAATYVFRSSTIFAPLAAAARLANQVFHLSPDHRWLLCLDELEDLKPRQMAALTTLLRGSVPNLVMKITTQPYTIEEQTGTHFAAETSAVDHRDYNIHRLQIDPGTVEYRHFVSEIVRKRLGSPTGDGEQMAKSLFGTSSFAERAETVDRTFPKRREEILASTNADSARKRIPVAAIRTLRRAFEGHRNSVAYSGWDTLVRLSDGNPGMFVRLLNELGVHEGSNKLDAETQHSTVTDLAKAWHEWSQALYSDGTRLHRMIGEIGELLSNRIHTRAIEDKEAADEMNRFALDLRDLPSADATALKVGARHGLLVAEENRSSLHYPLGEGIWRLSYALAPKFWLLPRRGRVGAGLTRQLSLIPRDTSFDERRSVPTDRDNEEV